MKYTVSVAMGPVEDLVDIAKTAEDVGFVPFYVGGHTEVALKRAARDSDGWTSAAVCIDKFGVDGHRGLAAAGITDNIVIPWMFDGLGFDAPLDKKKDSLKRFADTYIHSGWQQ